MQAGLPVLAPERPSDPGFLGTLRELDVDCCPVVAYGALIPPAALAVPRHGWVNLHFSLLPAWRGAA
ncbi:MAG: methionyl-tRNA formyltransferase, partial [Pseudonocardiales bacterium]|nr:methionyl-tRNA formyltransferase [Pseudonocardiales bacterium]